MTRPYRVGLTGSVAAGKSSVGDLFAGWGAYRIDADELAREVVLPGGSALERIRDRWGADILAPDGTLDRDAMRRVVFSAEKDRRELEAIVHAGVRALREEHRSAAASASVPLLVEEVPLLFEAGLEDEYDAIVVVDAPWKARAARAAETRGWSAAEFEAVEASQHPVAEKRLQADYVIDNAADREALSREALGVWEALTRAAAMDPTSEDGVDARHDAT